MKYKLLKIAFVLLLGLVLTGLQAQTMYVKNKSGAEATYSFSDIRKITFTPGNMAVSKTTGVSDTYELSSLRYFNFTDLNASIIFNEQKNETTIATLYPNPVSEVLSIQLDLLQNEALTVAILSIEGKVISKQIIQNNNKLYQANISELPKGLYLCQITGNTTNETVKFIKN